MMHVISLGAGVQSTTMALMAAQGELEPMPDCAIFADTGAEPRAVYEHLEWLETMLPFPVYRIQGGNLRTDIMKARKTGRFPLMPVPAYVAGGDGGMVSRSCTRDYKIRPIIKKVRELTGLTAKRAPKDVIVEQWIGISTDEAMRMKPSREAWIKHRWPLIEASKSRGSCIEWLKRNYPDRKVAKSACTFCPYHSDAEWRALTPAEFADAVVVDKLIRNGRSSIDASSRQLFLHRSMKPLDEVDLSTAEDRGQLNLFLNECEGMCGV
jgi:uncharacterized protein YbdZ (MbtH family)